MRLYYNRWRWGVEFATLREPNLGTGPVEGEEEFMALAENWYIPGLPMPREAQYAVALYWLRVGLKAFGVSGVFTKTFIYNKIVEASALYVWKVLAGFAVLAAAAYLVVWILNPAVKLHVEERDWKDGWMMRYEEKAWHARLLSWTAQGIPRFKRMAEVPAPILWEQWNAGWAGMKGDYWAFEGAWIEKRGGFPIYESYMWYTTLQTFVGLMTREHTDVYLLQEQYVGYMPPY